MMNKRSGNVRIIGGKWKGRKLPVAAVKGLRPTPGRVRETLFNWLQGHIYEARCLDLFAGSGAIGFEAVSRGASEVVLVEKHHKAAQQIVDNIKTLDTFQVVLKKSDAYQYLESTPEPFDIIFLDPPFRQDHLPYILAHIQQSKLLKNDGVIYLEQEKENLLDFESWDFEVYKKTKAGQSTAYLLEHK